MLSRREGSRGARPAARPAVLAFVIGGRVHALSLALVAGVAEIGTVTRLPSSDPLNLGLIVHRGAVLPLIDLGRRLAGGHAAVAAIEPSWQSAPGGASPTICIISRSEPAVAFPVEAVLGLQPASANPELETAAPSWEILDPFLVDLARGQDPAD
jgi:chemotaxis signal transduction protein